MKKIHHQDTLVLAVEGASKTYLQWQRSGKMKDIVKNIFRPEKKEIAALSNLSLHVQKGEFVAYAGANGAGKSTTIKLLSGILQPSGGTVRVLGLNPAKHRVKLMSKVGVLFGQRSDLWWDQPVIASYEWKRSVWNIAPQTYEKMLQIVIEMLDLESILQTCARELSLGQKMRADLGMLFLHSPEIIFLDEPTLGLDVLAKKRLIKFLRHMNEENGTTILVTSHDMDDLQEMARRIVLISGGKLAFDGSFDDLRGIRKDSMTIKVSTEIGAQASAPGLQIASQNEMGEQVYTYSGEAAGMQKVLQSIAALPGIQGIEIQKAPIEDVIAGLYEDWQKVPPV